MLDDVLIKDCADPSLKPAIVEQFATAAGSADPLLVTLRSGAQLILCRRPNRPTKRWRSCGNMRETRWSVSV